MNREIKFRAWDKKNKIWSLGDDWSLEEIAANYDVWKDLELEWMQYTGLKDKNGVEIYEGDIVKGGVVYDFEDNGIAEVKIGEFEVDSSGKEYSSITCYGIYNKIIKSKYKNSEHGEFLPKEIEVIGNIYENPELLTNSI